MKAEVILGRIQVFSVALYIPKRQAWKMEINEDDVYPRARAHTHTRVKRASRGIRTAAYKER